MAKCVRIEEQSGLLNLVYTRRNEDDGREKA
jgi:hypothetical protein